ncbi:Bug family tripartite tricarboxylate transporter substrate binding protein [Falsiroseomonas oryziterrae]|uniref:Bug family tripartite tricarboxylate transporter substrate binding protein n=1 Tax=Falsiroseomonas oryziterrae TaxID=2911368 RepID=UPI001F343217|nr:tripartite tricarboxylate transporter substrate binding protein [Roseomonas sp. NPKOSM-4]
MSPLPRRTMLALPAALAAPAIAQAQGRPITIVVPFGAGTNVDAIARVAANELAPRIGQPVVVENLPGAGGTIATERVARAAPDGATLLLGVDSVLNVAPLVTPSAVRYDPIRDFTAVHMLATLPLLLIGRPDLPATLPELIALNATRSQPFTYATSGTGTSLHLFGEMLAGRTGLKLEHVPYRIATQIFPDLMAGRVDLAVSTLTSSGPLVREGRVRGFGISSPERHPFLPEQITFAEQAATRGMTSELYQGLFAPARTDPAFVARLAAALAEALATPAAIERIRALGMTPSAMGPDATNRFVRDEAERYAALVRAAANIQPQ